jgi:hypothetical protein
MPNPLSTVRGTTQQALYPVTRTVEFVTRVNIAANGSEQRWVVRGPLNNFQLPYSELLKADAAAQEFWFENARGKFDRTLSLTIDGITYLDLTSDSDTFSQVQRQQRSYDTQISVRQTRNPLWVPAPAPSSYPKLTNGLSAQYPYTRTVRFATIVNDQEVGTRYSLSTYGGPFDNFPTDGLFSWKLDYPVLTEVDAATLENFFLACQGRYHRFSFTDPDTGIVHPNCRLDQDSLPLRYDMARRGGHHISTSLSVSEFFIPTPPA